MARLPVDQREVHAMGGKFSQGRIRQLARIRSEITVILSILTLFIYKMNETKDRMEQLEKEVEDLVQDSDDTT